MSRMEAGLRGTSEADVGGLCSTYGITGAHRQRLLNLAKYAKEERWLQTTDYDTDVSTFAWLEGRASTIFNYEINYIPGLLQTGEYIRAIMEAFDLPEKTIERRKLGRIERQRVLRRDPKPAFSAIVDQSALMRPIGGRDAHRRQLEYLVESAARGVVQLRVIPSSVAAHPGLDGHFHLWKFDNRGPVVHTENRLCGVFMEDVEAISIYTLDLGTLERIALSTVESVHLIANLAADLE
jgi:hypothetical protein